MKSTNHPMSIGFMVFWEAWSPSDNDCGNYSSKLLVLRPARSLKSVPLESMAVC